MKKYRFQVKPSADGQWVYQFIAANGQVMMTSETVHNMQDAIDSCSSVQRHAYDAPVVVLDADDKVVEVLS